MEWRGRKQSGNIEDWCQMSGRSGGSVRAGEVGGVGIIAYFLGLDVTPFLNGGALDTGPSGPAAEMATDDIAAVELVSVVLADTEAVWTTLFKSQAGMGYDPVTLVLFKGVTTSACGSASGATGPFYCPGDKKVYLTTDLFVTMEQQLCAGGDFAMAMWWHMRWRIMCRMNWGSFGRPVRRARK